MNLFFLILQDQSGGNPLIFFVLVFGVFWFFMIRPQIKKQKQERKFREQIKKGDKVVTTGGIHGKVTEVSERTVNIDIGNTIVKCEKSGLSVDFSKPKE